MDGSDLAQDVDPEGGLGHITSIAVLIGVFAAVIAAGTIWLLMTDPVTVANAIEEGEISPLVRRLAEVFYQAISGLLKYL